MPTTNAAMAVNTMDAAPLECGGFFSVVAAAAVVEVVVEEELVSSNLVLVGSATVDNLRVFSFVYTYTFSWAES